MSKRTKGEGTIRKRSDGRWEGRYVNCIGETKYIYGKNKNEVRNELKNVIYDYNATNHQEIRGDITLEAMKEAKDEATDPVVGMQERGDMSVFINAFTNRDAASFSSCTPAAAG